MIVSLAAGITLPVSAPAQEASDPTSPSPRAGGIQSREAAGGSRASETGKPILPGLTLSRQASDRAQPRTNPSNVVGEAISPDCPFLTQTLNELMAYARVNYVNLYRIALAQRRAGASQEVVRQALAENLCLAEGMGTEE